jgi:hypothetical protein
MSYQIGELQNTYLVTQLQEIIEIRLLFLFKKNNYLLSAKAYILIFREELLYKVWRNNILMLSPTLIFKKKKTNPKVLINICVIIHVGKVVFYASFMCMVHTLYLHMEI